MKRREHLDYYRVAVIVLAAITLIAVVLLWPDGDRESDLKFGSPTPTQKAEVDKVETVDCTVPIENATCFEATFTLKSGPDEGEQGTLDVTSRSADTLVDAGDDIKVAAIQTEGGPTTYSLIDFERGPPLVLLAVAFTLLVLLFGRLRGALSLVGLAASLAIVLLFIIPAILDSQPPLAVALAGSMAVMLITISLAHGVGPKSIAAILGTSVSLLLVGLLAVIFTSAANLTGFTSE